MFAPATITRRTAVVAAGLAFASTAVVATVAEAKPSAPTPRACAFAIPADAKQTDLSLRKGGAMRLIDVDADRNRDLALLDINKDGAWDAGAADCNSDGKWDHRWLDRSGDGAVTPGEVKAILRAPKAVKVCLVAKRAHKKTCRSHPQWILGLRKMPKGFPVMAAQPQQPAQPKQPVQPQPQPQPQPDQKPQPPARIPLTMADISGDTFREPLFGDSTLAAIDSKLVSGAQGDEVLVGTMGGAKLIGVTNIDADIRDDEFVVEDPTVLPEDTSRLLIDLDTDLDAVVVGTMGGATVEYVDNDIDHDDKDIVIHDPNAPAGTVFLFDLDGDGDLDLMRSRN
jgi:hypothetical protein